MSDGQKISGRGGARAGSGAKPSTLTGFVRRSKQPEKLRRDIKCAALQMLVDWARAELRAELGPKGKMKQFRKKVGALLSPKAKAPGSV